jgi:hypothetical protein
MLLLLLPQVALFAALLLCAFAATDATRIGTPRKLAQAAGIGEADVGWHISKCVAYLPQYVCNKDGGWMVASCNGDICGACRAYVGVQSASVCRPGGTVMCCRTG